MLIKVIRNLIGNRNVPAEGDVLRLARELLDRSQHEDAIDILTTLLEYKPDCAEALILRGVAKRAIDRAQESRADLSRALALAPNDPNGLYEMAMTAHVLGDNRIAVEYCERARRIVPGFNKPFMLQAQIRFSGPHYLEVLARIIDHVRPRTYVEIGIFQGESLRLARPPTLAIGIDPEPRLTEPLGGNHKVFAETSDAFFESHDLRAEFGGMPVDLAFIDGMHHFEFALRDFANLERHCTRDSTILIHDCYPLDRESAGRDPRPSSWSGDIWRLIVLLKKYRPDLSVRTIGTAPTGLGFVRNLDPGSRYLLEHYDRLRAEFLALDYSCLDLDMAEKLGLFPNDWSRIRALLN
jgi:Methyltransferase domain